VIDYIQKGGLLMWPILACSIISIAVFAERVFYLHRATIHVGEFLKGLSNLIQRRNFAEALHESAGTPGPVARVIHSAIIRHDAPRSELREIVQEAGQLEVPKLERFLGVLATLAFLAPLLGLLGTVAGMIDAFGTIASHGGYATVTELSSGVYKSLLTTAAGLVVATPTFVGTLSICIVFFPVVVFRPRVEVPVRGRGFVFGVAYKNGAEIANPPAVCGHVEKIDGGKICARLFQDAFH